MQEKTDIKSLSLEELRLEADKLSLPKYRANQIFEWLHIHGVSSFDEMKNIPKDLKTVLGEKFFISSLSIEKKLVSEIDSTVKYLFRLYDGEFVESVVMKYKYGYTICVSSQIGCKMGCTFCASTLAGFFRNLLPGEIESQIHTAQKDLNIRISNVVMMGIGEPLDNFNNTVKFIRLINSERGLNISMRNITVSTCGLVPQIYQLIDEKLPITLTLSLHAPTDEIRSKTMPVNNKWGIQKTVEAMKKYSENTGRRVSFEYTLIKGLNDSDECAKQLYYLLKDVHCHVNLIPVNNVEERNNIRSSERRINSFCETLKSCGINATIRRTLGSDINASCGQLRRNKKQGGMFIENSSQN